MVLPEEGRPETISSNKHQQKVLAFTRIAWFTSTRDGNITEEGAVVVWCHFNPKEKVPPKNHHTPHCRKRPDPPPPPLFKPQTENTKIHLKQI